MKKVEGWFSFLLTLGLILVLLGLGFILIMAAWVPPASGMGLDFGDGGSDQSGQVAHLGRLDVGAHGPGRVAVDPQGRFYITDPERYRVFVTDARGQSTVAVDTCAYPSAIAVGPDGRLYLGDALTHAVYVLDAQGRFLHALGAGQDEFSWPHDIAVNPVSGRVYVADSFGNEVKVYSPAGEFIDSLTGPDGDPLDFPTAVAVDPSGMNVVVADHNNGRLQRFDTDGSWLNPIVPLVPLTRPVGLTLDNQGQIYTADAFKSKVFIFDLGGADLGTVGQYGEEVGDLRVPTDTILDPFGRLAVVSYNNGVVELYGPEGYSEPPAEVPLPALFSLTHPCAAPPPPPPPPPPPVIEGSVVYKPATLKLSAGGKTVKAYIELADGSATDIVVSTVVLNDQVSAELVGWGLKDQDNDGLVELKVLFDRQAVEALIDPTAQEAELVVTGQVGDDATFEARNTISVKP